MQITIDLPEASATDLMLEFHGRLTNPSLGTTARIAFDAAFNAIANELVLLHPNKAEIINSLRSELADLHQTNHILTRKGLEASEAVEDKLRSLWQNPQTDLNP